MTIENIEIAVAESVHELQNYIKDLVEDGYVPHGGISISLNKHKDMAIAQTMVKYF
tara:strand:- start:429 stop:596 length:168 start_codon:yes stop_codon:yes gene_type:complete